MFDHIVLLTDLSDVTRLAFRPLAALARVFDARITVFHAFRGSSELFYLEGDAARMREVIDAADRDRAMPVLRAWQEELAALDVRAEIVARVGSTFDLAVDALVELRADLAIVTTQGFAEFTGRVLGSPTARLIRDSRIPVLSVNELFGDGVASFEGFNRIVHPVDFSGDWRHTLRAGEELAAEVGGRIDLVDVVQPIHHQTLTTPEGEILLPKDLQYQIRSKLQARLSDAAHEVAKVPAYWQLIEDNKPGSAVMAYADRVRADLIVVHAISRDTVRNTLLGSMAEHVIKHARCPVLSVPDSWQPGAK